MFGRTIQKSHNNPFTGRGWMGVNNAAGWSLLISSGYWKRTSNSLLCSTTHPYHFPNHEIGGCLDSLDPPSSWKICVYKTVPFLQDPESLSLNWILIVLSTKWYTMYTIHDQASMIQCMGRHGYPMPTTKSQAVSQGSLPSCTYLGWSSHINGAGWWFLSHKKPSSSWFWVVR